MTALHMAWGMEDFKLACYALHSAIHEELYHPKGAEFAAESATWAPWAHTPVPGLYSGHARHTLDMCEAVPAVLWCCRVTPGQPILNNIIAKACLPATMNCFEHRGWRAWEPECMCWGTSTNKVFALKVYKVHVLCFCPTEGWEYSFNLLVILVTPTLRRNQRNPTGASLARW